MTREIETRLIQNDVKPTAMRLLVLDFLSKQNKAVSLSDIESSMEHSDRITLYRTLKTFEEKCIIHSIYDGTGVTKYALCEEGCNCLYSQDLHVHFFCNECKETVCLPKSRIPTINLPDDFKAEEASLLVKGRCKSCLL